MTGFPNPLGRLAPRTSVRQCAPSRPYSLMAAFNRIRQCLDYKSRRHRLTGFHHQRRKTSPQIHSPNYQTLFNIHNPNQDHRARG
jgi:hypothetical protein